MNNTPQYDYIITNRQPDGQGGFTNDMNKNGELSFCTANLDSIDFSIIDSEAFIGCLKEDLINVSENNKVGLCIFIHGFNTSWSTDESNSIQKTTNSWFSNLRKSGGYTGGVQLAFDWPSGTEAYDFWLAKDNAQFTGQHSFPFLVSFVNEVKSLLSSSGILLNVQVLSHSMGNYCLYEGAGKFAQGDISQLLMVAAEFDRFGFNPSCNPYLSGAALSAVCSNITVYYSTNDDVLCTPNDKGTIGDSWCEMGIYGPEYPPDSEIYHNIIGLDCSDVVNQTNSSKYNSPLIHTSYFFIPEVLCDMASTLQGESVSDRTSVNDSTQHFSMNS